MKRPKRGFTLIELLVVIGLIAVLAGVLGLALGRGNSGAALQSSQATLQGLFSSARGQAAIAQENAQIVINVDPDSEGFLREFHVVVAGKAVGSAVTLSEGIYVVPRPGTGGLSGSVNHDNTNGSWSNDITTNITTSEIPVDGVSGRFAPIFEITSRGTPTVSGSVTRVVLSPAERVAASEITFTNPSAVRGVSISHYGVLTMLNDSSAMQ